MKINVHLDYTVQLDIGVREAERLMKGDSKAEYELVRQAQKIVARAADGDIAVPAIVFSNATIEAVG